MLVVTVDTDRTDTQPEHFKNLDRKPSKYVMTDSRTEYGVQNLKSFIAAVEASNPGFQIFWGPKEQFEAQFRGKRIGVNFGEEEYLNDTNEIKVAVKPRFFFDYAKCYEIKPPARKQLPHQAPPQYQQAYQNGYQAAQNNPPQWQQPTAQPAPYVPYQQPQPQPQPNVVNQYQQPVPQQATLEGFMQISPQNDEDLPFG